MDFIFWSKVRFGDIGFGARMAGFESQLHHLWLCDLGQVNLNALCLSFFKLR